MCSPTNHIFLYFQFSSICNQKSKPNIDLQDWAFRPFAGDIGQSNLKLRLQIRWHMLTQDLGLKCKDGR